MKLSFSGWGRFLALGLLLIGVSPMALADVYLNGPNGASVWTVYAFGNAQAVSDAFRAINNFTASNTFHAVISMIAMFGVLAVGLSSGFSGAMAKNFISYLVTVFLITYLFFGVGGSGPLVISVEVEDFSYTPANSGGGSWTKGGLITGPVTVPAVVGIPASIISTAGHELTRQIEASFMLPDALKLSNGAPFNLPAAMVADASRAKITDPNLASSFAYYVQDCFVISVARGEVSPTVLTESTDFLKDIATNNEMVLVTTMLTPGSEGVSDVVSCKKGYEYIFNKIGNAGTDAASFMNKASAWAKTPALSVVNASADSVAQWVSSNGAMSGAGMVKQAAVLSSFSTASKQVAAQTGNSEFLTALAIEQATQSQVTGWIVGAEIFNRMMGYIFAILQVFVYAITPLVLAASIVPSLGMALLKNFAQIMLWLASWQPLLAIVNFVVISMQRDDLAMVMNNGVGAVGFTLNNLGVTTDKAANLRAAALFVGTMTPALAWAMVKGSVDFSSVISSAVGEKFASSAANTMTTGNYSLNQASMDSFTANKVSTAPTGDFGYGQTSTGGVVNKANDLGGEVIKAGADQPKVTVSNLTGVSSQASSGITTQNGVAGGLNFAASETGGTGATGADTVTGTSSSVAAAGESKTFTGQGQGRLDYQPGGGKKTPGTYAAPAGDVTTGAPGAGAPGADKSKDNKPVAPSTTELKKPAENTGNDVRAGLGLSGTGALAGVRSQQDSDAFSKVRAGTATTQYGNTGQVGLVGSTTTSRADMASNIVSAIQSKNITTTGLNTPDANAALHAHVQGTAVKSALSTRSKRVGEDSGPLTPASVPEVIKAHDDAEKKSDTRIEEQGNKAELEKSNAEKKAKGHIKSGKAGTARDRKAALGMQSAAQKSPFGKLKEPIKEVLNATEQKLDNAVDAYQKMSPAERAAAVGVALTTLTAAKVGKDAYKNRDEHKPKSKDSSKPSGNDAKKDKKPESSQPGAPAQHGAPAQQGAPQQRNPQALVTQPMTTQPHVEQGMQPPAAQDARNVAQAGAPTNSVTDMGQRVADAGLQPERSNSNQAAELAAMESRATVAEQKTSQLTAQMHDAEHILSSARGAQELAEVMPVIDDARAKVRPT